MTRRAPLLTFLLLVCLACPSAATAQFRGSREGLTRRTKDNPTVLAAIADAVDGVEDVAARVVRTDGDRPNEHLALGTIVGDGEVLTKASELRGTYGVLLPGMIDHRGDEENAQAIPAELVGVVPEHDLALLRFDPADTPRNARAKAAVFADDSTVRVGEFLVSVGPTPGLVKYGIRSVGPLSIPKTTPFLGIGMETLDTGEIVIVQVTPYSGAARAGLQAGDVLLKIDDVPVRRQNSVPGILSTKDVGERIRITYRRDGEEAVTRVRLGSRPRGTVRAIQQNQLGNFLSARASGFDEVIQHDAVLLPTDMGGPLASLEGEVVGINIARAGRVETFALPADVVLAVLDDLRMGKYAPTTRTALDPGEGPSVQPPLQPDEE